NYTLGIREQIIFPEIDYDKVEKVKGMNVTIVTTARTDEEGRALLKYLGMPFPPEQGERSWRKSRRWWQRPASRSSRSGSTTAARSAGGRVPSSGSSRCAGSASGCGRSAARSLV